MNSDQDKAFSERMHREAAGTRNIGMTSSEGMANMYANSAALGAYLAGAAQDPYQTWRERQMEISRTSVRLREDVQ